LVSSAMAFAPFAEDTNKKITIDPKQELTVDPRVGGLDFDDMSLANICGIKSIFSQFPWANAAIPLTTVLWKCGVCPSIVSSYVSGVTRYNQPTALAFIAALHEYWTGDLVFTFTVACNAFTRGVLAIVYEPNVSQYSLITSHTSMNKQYVTLWDIQQTQSVEVRVSWASYRAWLKSRLAADCYKTESTIDSSQVGYSNGFIYVTPFTELQTNDTTVYPDIFVSVHGENMHWNGLTLNNTPGARVIYTQSSIETCVPQVPVSQININMSDRDETKLTQEYFGEQILSLRQIMRRFMTNSDGSYTSGTFSAPYVRLLNRSCFPRNNLTYGSTSVSTNYDIYTHLAYAYMGFRGGIKHRVRNMPIGSISQSWISKVSLDTPGDTSNFTTVVSGGVNLSNRSVLEGTVEFLPNINGAIEFETPMYTNNSFLFSFADVFTPNSSTDLTDPTFFRNYILREDEGVLTSSFTLGLLDDIAAAEDFTFLRFEGAPYYTS